MGDTFREYKGTVNDGMKYGKWTFKRLLWPILLLIILLGVLGFVLRTCSQPARIIEKTLDADNVIYNYEWFKKQYNAVIAAEQQIVVLEKSIKDFKADAGDRSNWQWGDREHYNRLSTRLDGLKTHRETLVADYNAKSAMINRVIFKGRELPETLK